MGLVIPSDKYFDSSTKLTPETFNDIWDTINANIRGGGEYTLRDLRDGTSTLRIFRPNASGVWGPSEIIIPVRDNTEYTGDLGMPTEANFDIDIDFNHELFGSIDVQYNYDGTWHDTFPATVPWGRTYFIKLTFNYNDSPPSYEEVANEVAFKLKVRMSSPSDDGSGGIGSGSHISTIMIYGFCADLPYYKGLRPYAIILPDKLFIDKTLDDEITVDYRCYWGEYTPDDLKWSSVDNTGHSYGYGYLDDFYSGSFLVDLSSIHNDVSYIDIILTQTCESGEMWQSSFRLNVIRSTSNRVILSHNNDPINPTIAQYNENIGGASFNYTFKLTTENSFIPDIDPTERQFTLNLLNQSWTTNGDNLGDRVEGIKYRAYKPDGSTVEGDYNLGDVVSDDTDGISFVEWYVKLSDDKLYETVTDEGGAYTQFMVPYKFQVTVTDGASTTYTDEDCVLVWTGNNRLLPVLSFSPPAVSTSSGPVTTSLILKSINNPLTVGDLRSMGFDIPDSYRDSDIVSSFKMHVSTISGGASTVEYYDESTDSWVSELTIEGISPVSYLEKNIAVRVSGNENVTVNLTLSAVLSGGEEYEFISGTADLVVYREAGASSSSGGASEIIDTNLVIISGNTDWTWSDDVDLFDYAFLNIRTLDFGQVKIGDDIEGYLGDSDFVRISHPYIETHVDTVNGLSLKISDVPEGGKFYLIIPREPGLAIVDALPPVYTLLATIYVYKKTVTPGHDVIRCVVKGNNRFNIKILDYSHVETFGPHNAYVGEITPAFKVLGKTDINDYTSLVDHGLGDGQIFISSSKFADFSTGTERPVISGVREFVTGSKVKLSSLTPDGFVTVILGDSEEEKYPNIDIAKTFYLTASDAVSDSPDYSYSIFDSDPGDTTIVLSSHFSPVEIWSKLDAERLIVLVEPIMNGLDYNLLSSVSASSFGDIVEHVTYIDGTVSGSGEIRIKHYGMVKSGSTVKYYKFPVKITLIGTTFGLGRPFGGSGGIA